MTHCSTQLAFPFFKESKLVADFQGGSVVTDAGLLLVRQFDDQIEFSAALSDVIYDPRDPRFIRHPQRDLIRQRLYQIIAGYEDCNDASRLRRDPIFKAVTGRAPQDLDLASQPTLCRLENRISSHTLIEFAEAQVRLFIRTRPTPPKQITLDMDPSEARTYGFQQLTFFNGYYGSHMYFPNFLCDARTGFLLAAMLRAGNVGAAEGGLRTLARVVQMLRAAWPEVRIEFRADSNFADPDLLNWLDEQHIPYAIGMASNAVLKRLSADFVKAVQDRFGRATQPQRSFTSLRYAAKTWPRRRRMVVKVEVTDMGSNVRYVIVSRSGRSQDLYEWYTQRGGTIEDVIEELKNGFEGDRLSCQKFDANAFRLMMHTAAYNLMVLLREHTEIPEVQHASIETLRIKLLKVGAVVQQTARRIWVRLSSTWPFADLFGRVHATLVPQPDG